MNTQPARRCYRHLRNGARSLPLLAAAGLWHAPAMATDVGIGARVATLGVGAELSVALSDQIVLRVPFHTLKLDTSLRENQIRYEADLRLRSVGLIADYHPFAGSWRLSAGFYSNGNGASLIASEATGNDEFAVGGRRYRSAADNPLQMLGDIDFASVAPYAGFGWGNSARGDRSFYFSVELGAMFQGNINVDLSARGAAEDIESGERFSVDDNSTAAQHFRSELSREADALEDDLSSFRIFPVVAVALGFRF